MRALILVALASLLVSPAWAGKTEFKNGTVRESGWWGVDYTTKKAPVKTRKGEALVSEKSSQSRAKNGRFGKAFLTRTTYRDVEVKVPGSNKTKRISVEDRTGRTRRR